MVRGGEPKKSSLRRVPQVRIIAGRWRRRRLQLPPAELCRPMKDRTREALFNSLASWVPGSYVVDLFAGSGAVALEALSRGAEGATLIEAHPEVFAVLKQNVEETAGPEAERLCRLVQGDALELAPQLSYPRNRPWLVFFCPPYAMFSQREAELMHLVAWFAQQAPGESVLVVEAPERFPAQRLPELVSWHKRRYPPAEVYLGYMERT